MMNSSAPLACILVAAVFASCGGNAKQQQTVGETPPQPEEMPDIFDGDVNLTSGSVNPCQEYEGASESTWSYKVQANLDLSVKIYEGVLQASDAETLVSHMDKFKNRWNELFGLLCENAEQEGMLAEGQLQEATSCFEEILGKQRKFLQITSATDWIDIARATVLADDLEKCAPIIEPRGPKAMKTNPF